MKLIRADAQHIDEIDQLSISDHQQRGVDMMPSGNVSVNAFSNETIIFVETPIKYMERD